MVDHARPLWNRVLSWFENFLRKTEYMAAPTVAALATFPLGPGQVTDNLTGLANNTALGLGSIGTAGTQYYDDKIGVIQITTGVVPGSPNGTGTASIYIAMSEDGTHWTDDVDPTSNNGAVQSAKFISSQSLVQYLVQRIHCPASNTAYVFNAFSVFQKVGYLPTFWGLFVANNTGAPLSAVAAGHRAQHSLVSFA